MKFVAESALGSKALRRLEPVQPRTESLALTRLDTAQSNSIRRRPAQSRTARPARTQITPVIIVLGGRVFPTGPSLSVALRLAQAKQQFDDARRKGLHPYIVCSGGQGSDEHASEALIMAGWLTRRGVPAPAILLEEKSTSTEENLAFTAELLRQRDPVPGLQSNGRIRAVVVTSWQHIPRAEFFARSAGFEPAMRGARLPLRQLPKALIWEVGATGMALLRKISRHLP